MTVARDITTRAGRQFLELLDARRLPLLHLALLFAQQCSHALSLTILINARDHVGYVVVGVEARRHIHLGLVPRVR